MQVDQGRVIYIPDSKSYVAEASEIGLPPGRYPELIEITSGDGLNKVVRRFRSPVVERTPDGEDVAGYRYRGELPQDGSLLVIND